MGIAMGLCQDAKNQISNPSKVNVEIDHKYDVIKSNQIKLTEDNKKQSNITTSNFIMNHLKKDTTTTNTNTNTNTNITINNNSIEPLQKIKSKSPKKIHKKNLKGKNIINIGIIGGVEVGKSTFAIKLTENKFEQYYVPSIDIEKKTRAITLNKHNYILNFIVALGGEYDLLKYGKDFIECDFFLLFYDVSNEASFNEIVQNFNKLQNFLGFYEVSGNKIQNFCLIGNKCDLEAVTKFDSEKIKNFIDMYKIKHYEISCKTPKNINNVMSEIVEVFDKCAFPIKPKKKK